jgi:hypothetical protein
VSGMMYSRAFWRAELCGSHVLSSATMLSPKGILMTKEAMKTAKSLPRVSELEIQERISQRPMSFGLAGLFEADRPKRIGFGRSRGTRQSGNSKT